MQVHHHKIRKDEFSGFQYKVVKLIQNILALFILNVMSIWDKNDFEFQSGKFFGF